MYIKSKEYFYQKYWFCFLFDFFGKQNLTIKNNLGIKNNGTFRWCDTKSCKCFWIPGDKVFRQRRKIKWNLRIRLEIKFSWMKTVRYFLCSHCSILFWAMLRLIFLIGHSIALSSFLFTSSIPPSTIYQSIYNRREAFCERGGGYFLYLNRIVVKICVTLQCNRGRLDSKPSSDQ